MEYEPHQLGVGGTLWTAVKVASVVQDLFGTTFTDQGIRKILRRLGSHLTLIQRGFLRTWDPATSSHKMWALTLYPRLGTAEVVFQHLRSRPPFDTVDMRRQLRDRLNAIPGIDLAEGTLDRRPNFRLDVLTGEGGERVLEVLTWFRERCLEWLVTQG